MLIVSATRRLYRISTTDVKQCQEAQKVKLLVISCGLLSSKRHVSQTSDLVM